MVGVTGGIGSGKSTVCRMLAMLGVPVYDSDLHAKSLMEGPSLAGPIIEAFGPRSYSGGKLDRAYLAERVFGNEEALSKLNGIVHPAVMRDFYRWALTANSAAGYVVMESAIIFEHGLQENLDYVITVSAPRQVRLARAMMRDGAQETLIEQRMANQMSDPEREAIADFIINNDEHSLVWEQVLRIDKRLRSQATKRETAPHDAQREQ